MATVHSHAAAPFDFTETSFQWPHVNGASGTTTTLLVYVAAIDSGNIQALTATFSGAEVQAMTLAHKVTAPGTAYPSHHIFSLDNPSFHEVLTSGTIEITFDQSATVMGGASVVVTGVDTGQGINGVGDFVSVEDHVLTSAGMVSVPISTISGNLVIDCVVANAGLPDDHTPGEDQTLIVRSPLDSSGSAALSLSVRLALNTNEINMRRTGVTSINTVTTTAMVVYGN